MYTLQSALQSHDLITLRVIGEWWDRDLTGEQKLKCVQELTQVLGQLDLKLEMNYLGPEEAAAFDDLVKNGGRIPVAVFERQHGEMRQMGPGKMEREEPWFDPVSPVESLWYRGFLFRAFDESDTSDLVEYYYLPDEFIAQFQDNQFIKESLVEYNDSELSAAPTPDHYDAANQDAVDDLTTILASTLHNPLREGESDWLIPLLLNHNTTRASLLITLAWELDLLRLTDEGAKPARKVVDLLRATRDYQLRVLCDAWSHSTWNDLCHTPDLICDGSGWDNDPLLARTALLDAIPLDHEWYRISDLVQSIYQHNPDFQRPDGNYDSWYIRDRQSGAYLAGFSNWDAVEGRLLRFLLLGPMSWLGLVDIGKPDQVGQVSYRLTQAALSWLKNEAVSSSEVAVPIVVQDDGTIDVPFNANRYHRFQVARISEATRPVPNRPFRYCLTPASLKRAHDEGIDSHRILDFLKEASGRPLPASTRRGIERWAEQGTEGRIELMVVLRVRESDILEKLRASPRTQPFLSESIGDLASAVRPEEWSKLRTAAARLGLLLDAAPDLEE